MSLIDTHTHLESFHRKGILPAALAHAHEAGLEAMITIGTSTEDWTLYRSLAAEHRGVVHYSVGLHPCSVDENWEREIAQIGRFWMRHENDPLPVALGECGLDRFHLPKNDAALAGRIFAWQREAFAAQLEIARGLACPVVIHSRGAFDECVQMIDASGVDWTRVVFHCFVEDAPRMRELARRGGRGSFTGVLTYKNAATVREAAIEQGLSRFMVETDAPYLTPEPHRGKPNEPAFVRHTAEYAAAKVFGVTFDELARVSTQNARAFFGL
ncbi:MAG: TatD family hydrolase [Opitutaceae bacterium]|jgi:TatD DNase family protein|nr:TatD family hydrolase [Opitutaceae bacterium]